MFIHGKRLMPAALFALLLLCGLSTPVNSLAQNKEADTLYMKHSPKKANLWAILPGGGQVYNKKYWKLPIVYAGFGVIGYLAVTNRSEYLKYHDAYICSATLGEQCEDPLAQKYSTDDLKSIRDYYRRNTELSFIAGAAWYILQMVDAVVDAHLYYWNVSEDLSLKVEPVITPVYGVPLKLPTNRTPVNGIKITVRF